MIYRHGIVPKCSPVGDEVSFYLVLFYPICFKSETENPNLDYLVEIARTPRPSWWVETLNSTVLLSLTHPLRGLIWC